MFKFNLPKHLSMKDSPSMDSHLKTEIYNTYDGTPPSPTRKAMSPASPHNTSFSSTGGFLSPIPDSPGRTVRAATGKNVPGPAGSGPFAIKPRDDGGDEDVPMDFSQYLSDAHLSTTKPLIDSHLLGLSLHPAIRQANAAEASSSTAASTVAVYAPGRNTCANLAKSLNPDFKRVLKSFTSSECIAQIRRNNSDPLRTRNSVRLIVANLDQSALSILSHVESRLSDPLLRRMPVIPVLLTVSSGTLTAALSRTRGGQMAQQLDLLAAALEHRVVCGYVCDTVPAADLVRIMGSVIGRSAGVFAAYADLRVSRTEFTYPSYRGDQENDDGEEEEEGENGGEADGPPVKEITPRSMTLQKAWAKTSDHTGGSIMKRMSSGVLSVNKSSALATKILMGGTFQGARMETKMRKKPKKVGLASNTLRPKLYRKFSRKTLLPSTPRNSAGFFLVEDEQGGEGAAAATNGGGKNNGSLLVGALSGRSGAAGGSTPAHPSGTPPTPGGSQASSGSAVLIAPEMQPFVVRPKPELGSPRTSRGLSIKKVQVLQTLVDAHSEAKTASLRTGARRRATGSESIVSMNTSTVLKSTFAANTAPDLVDMSFIPEEEQAEELERRASSFAVKFRAKFVAKRDARISGAIEEDGPADSPGEETNAFAAMFQRPKSAGIGRSSKSKSSIVNPNLGQVIVAAMAKKKQQKTLTEVLAEARSMPQDLLQYDLLEIKPTQTSASTAANTFMRTGYGFQVKLDYGAARTYFSRAIMADKRCSAAWYCRGVANDKEGEFFKALQDFGTALKLELDKKSRKSHSLGAGETNHPDEAKAAKRSDLRNKTAGAAGAGPGGGPSIATLDSHGAGPAAAVQNVAKLKAPPPGVTLPRIYFNRSLVHVHIGDDAAALADLGKATKLDPKDKLARGARAMILRRLGRFLESQADYARLEKQREDEEEQRRVKALLEGDRAAGGGAAKKTKKGSRPKSAPAVRGGSGRRGGAGEGGLKVKGKGKEGGDSGGGSGGDTGGGVSPKQSSPPEVKDNRGSPDLPPKKDPTKKLDKEGAKERQGRREVRGGTLGGPASSIDRTPPTSPEKTIKVTAKEKAELSHLILTDMDDGLELIDSGDESEGPELVDSDDDDEVSKVEESEEVRVSADSTPTAPVSKSRIVEEGGGKGSPAAVPIAAADAGGAAAPPTVKFSDEKNAFFAPDQTTESAPNLAAFKVMNKIGADIFDAIFSVPTDLQKALLVPPETRKAADLDKIVRVFENYEITEKMDPKILRELAKVCEYRTVNAGCAAFLQGEHADALTFCLSGAITVKMTDDNLRSHSVGSVGPGEHFGDYSLLMRGSKADKALYARSINERAGESEEPPSPKHGGGGGGKGNGGGEEEEKAAVRKQVAPLRETYFCDEPCELLLIMKDDFDKYFRDICNALQREKFQILKRSKIFKGWSVDAIVRLARMARMKLIPRLKNVVVQGEECDSMFFIARGICRVLKYPDRCSQVKREKEELQKALDFSRTRYSYHRSMHPGLHTPHHGAHEPPVDPLRGTVAKATARIDGERGVFIPHGHVTRGEKAQEELEDRIAECGRKGRQFAKEDAELKGRKEAKELSILVAPAFFGQESVADPEAGRAQGTVVADTAVHALVVHRVMVRAFDVTAEFLEKVKRRAPSYPDDIKLKKDMDGNKDWDRFKAAQMLGIKKTKWSVKDHGAVVLEMPGGNSVVVDRVEKRGDLLRGLGL